MARRRREPEPPGLLAVEGAPGAGKSALVAGWSVRAGARRVELDAETNPFLEEALAEPSSRAFSAQMYFLLARHRLQAELRQGELFARHTVSDGLFHRDRLYAMVMLNEAELALYDRIYRLLEPRAVLPDLVVWLRARPEILLDRLRARGRRRDRSIGLERLERLAASYAAFFDAWRGSRLLVIDVSATELEEDDEALEGVILEIRRAARQLGPGERAELKLPRRS